MKISREQIAKAIQEFKKKGGKIKKTQFSYSPSKRYLKNLRAELNGLNLDWA